MNILELSLLVSNISYESNDWISNVKYNENFNLDYYCINNINLKCIKFIRDNNLNIFIKQKNYFGLTNICVLEYEDKLIISFSGFSESVQLFNMLDFLLEYSNDLECYVHKGFNYIFKNISDEVKLIIDSYEKENIIFTGHSLGAGIAKIMCLFFNKVHERKYNCITFASPLIGNKSFEDAYSLYVRNTINFLSQDDFLIDFPFLRRYDQKKTYMIEEKTVIPFRFSRYMLFYNFLTLNFDAHRLNYLYQNLSSIKLNDFTFS